MTEAKPSRILNLNITVDYLRHWTDPEAIREIIANAYDADPAAVQMSSPSTDILSITTPNTRPTIQQLTSFGETTKTNDGTTIGQFGEGVKCAFHVLTRDHGPDSVTVHLPGHIATFCFRPPFPDFKPTLHMLLWDDPSTLESTGCTIKVQGIDVKNCIEGRFIPPPDNLTKRLLLKPSPSLLRIFYRGIFCADQPLYRSLFDWNVQKAKMSRDRNIVDISALFSEVVPALSDMMTPEVAHTIVSACFNPTRTSSSTSIAEVCALYNETNSPGFSKCVEAFRDAFHDLFSPNVCIGTSPSYTRRASDNGYLVLNDENTDSMLLFCLRCYHPTTRKPYLPFDYQVAPIPPSLKPTIVEPSPKQRHTLSLYASCIQRIFPSGSRTPSLTLVKPNPDIADGAAIFLDTSITPPAIRIDATTVGSVPNPAILTRIIRTVIQYAPFDTSRGIEENALSSLSSVLLSTATPETPDATITEE